MRATACAFLILTTLCLPLAAADDDPLAGFSADEKAQLAANKVVVKSEVYTNKDGQRAARGKAYVVIQKSPDVPYAILSDYQKMPEFMPRLKKITILSKDAAGMKVRQDISVPLNTVSYTLDLKFAPDVRRMDWTLDKSASNDIKDTAGSWEFLPYEDGKTLVRYTISVETGRFVPKFLEDYLVKKDLPEVLMSMKRRAESGGTWKKD